MKHSKKIVCKCVNCGKTFMRYPSQIGTQGIISGLGKYCGKKCQADYKCGKTGNRKNIPVDKIIKEYEAGDSCKLIASRYGVTNVTILHRLKENSVAIRGPHGWHDLSDDTHEKLINSAKTRTGINNARWIAIPVNDIVAMYRAGATTSEIGGQYGVSPHLVGKRLAAAGIILRDPGWGKSHTCSDGHVVNSRWEYIVDEWLNGHGVEHIIHPAYPWNKKFRADFLAKGIYVEVFGISGNHNYTLRSREKSRNCARFGLGFTSISPAQIKNNDFSSLDMLL